MDNNKTTRVDGPSSSHNSIYKKNYCNEVCGFPLRVQGWSKVKNRFEGCLKGSKGWFWSLWIEAIMWVFF